MRCDRRWFYLAPLSLGVHGGQATHVAEFCEALAHSRPLALFGPPPAPAALPMIPFVPLSLPARPPRELVFQARAARALLLAGRSLKPAVIYARAAAFNLGAIMAARRLGIPCVLELNGLPALEYELERGARSAPMRRMFYTLLARLEHRLASGIVAVTPQLADVARQNGARAVHVAPNGVNPHRFVPGDGAVARRMLGIPPEAQVVGFAGNFAAWQGLDLLVEAVLQLAPAHPQLHLVLIGDGVERARLEARAAPLGARVRFTGRLPHRQVPPLLAACDVLAAPLAPIERNRRTGVSPLKVFEYLALGCPVLAAALPGMEFIEVMRLGALFAPGNAAALAERLQWLLNLPHAERVAIGARARAAAEGSFAWTTIVDGVITFVEEVRP